MTTKELDEKLDAVLEEAHNRSADLLISDDFKDEKRREKAKANYRANTKRQIEQVFKEAGYTRTGTQEVFRSAALGAISKMIDDLPPMMTGQEFYDRFEDEFLAAKKPSINDVDRELILDAARCAAGIEEAE